METRVSHLFAGEDRDFWLPMARVVAFEREADCSIFSLFYSLGENLGESMGAPLLLGPSEARLKQCHALIRNALIGAGEDEREVRDLIATYCFPARPAIHDLALTFTILRGAIYGIQLPEGSKKNAAEANPSDSTKASSSSTVPSSG